MALVGRAHPYASEPRIFRKGYRPSTGSQPATHSANSARFAVRSVPGDNRCQSEAAAGRKTSKTARPGPLCAAESTPATGSPTRTAVADVVGDSVLYALTSACMCEISAASFVIAHPVGIYGGIATTSARDADVALLTRNSSIDSANPRKRRKRPAGPNELRPNPALQDGPAPRGVRSRDAIPQAISQNKTWWLKVHTPGGGIRANTHGYPN